MIQEIIIYLHRVYVLFSFVLTVALYFTDDNTVVVFRDC